MVDSIFQQSVESERGEHMSADEPTIPGNIVNGGIINSDQFYAAISAPQEIGVDVEDIPLLPFEEILNVFKQRAKDGYIYSLDEVRFGYMAYIDLTKKGEEYVLLPVWAAKGRTTNDPNIPFDLKTAQYILHYSGYNDNSIIVVNPQTGETYDFAYDIRPDRRYVPDRLTSIKKTDTI